MELKVYNWVAVYFTLALASGMEFSPKKTEDVLANSVLAAGLKFFDQQEPIIVVPTMYSVGSDIVKLTHLDTLISVLDEGNLCVEGGTTVKTRSDPKHSLDNFTKSDIDNILDNFEFNPFGSSEEFVLKMVHSSGHWQLILPEVRSGETLLAQYINVMAFASDLWHVQLLADYLRLKVTVRSPFRVILILMLEEADESLDGWFYDASGLHDCVIIKWAGNSEVVTLYTVNTYELPYGFCGRFNKLIYLDTWFKQDNQESFLHNNNLQMHNIPKSLNCCRIEFDLDDFLPYYFSRNNSKFDGIYKRFLNHLNGAMTSTRNCDDVRSIEVKITQGQSKFVNVLFPTQKFTYFVPLAPWRPRWSWFTSVFRTSVWITFVCCLGLVVTTIRFAADRGSVAESKSYSSTSRCLMNLWAAILGVGVDRVPHSSRVRILFFSWVAFSFIVSTIFQSFFTSYFMLQVQDYQIDTKEELEREGYMLVYENFLSYIHFRNERSIYVEEISDSFLYAINKPKTALFSTKAMFNYFAATFCKPEELPLYYEFREFEGVWKMGMTFKKDPLLQNKLDALIYNLITTGITEKNLE